MTATSLGWVQGEDEVHRLSLNQHGHRLEIHPVGVSHLRIVVFGGIYGPVLDSLEEAKILAEMIAYGIFVRGLNELGFSVTTNPEIVHIQ